MGSGEPTASRRRFLEGGGAALLAGVLGSAGAGCAAGPRGAPAGGEPPVRRRRVVASTWDFGARANAATWAVLAAGVDHPLDACEVGAHVTENDPSVPTVGVGGRPNAEGHVELDAAVMRGDTLDCGAVGALRRVLHPVSVARRVMERTPHVVLVGEGAARFAREQGFDDEELLTDEAAAAWRRWRTETPAEEKRAWRPRDGDDHDTLGLIALDEGRFAVVVTTSGQAFKLPGRPGDTPIVGAGGYCDDEAGACVASGQGEEVVRVCGSFAVVEAMRRGAGPGEACFEVLARVRRNLQRTDREGVQVAMLAVDRHGRVGGGALRDGFEYAVTDAGGTELVDASVLGDGR